MSLQPASIELVEEETEDVGCCTESTAQPECWMDEDEVESLNVDYSFRSSDDWVSAGPVGGSWTDTQLKQERRRWFANWTQAEEWARTFYGKRYKRPVPEAALGNRWAFLIRGRGQKNDT